MIRADESGGRVIFQVRVQPNSSREGIEGEWQGALRIRVSVPPTDNRANEAVVELLVERLKRPRSAVRIIGGARGRLKRIEVQGATAKQVRALLEAPGSPHDDSLQETGEPTLRRKTHARHSGNPS
jgi:uncharacterized protein (TIGR00251 family)